MAYIQLQLHCICIRHTASNNTSSPPQLILQRGITTLAWSTYGYSLVLSEKSRCSQFLELSFAQMPPHHHRVSEIQPHRMHSVTNTHVAMNTTAQTSLPASASEEHPINGVMPPSPFADEAFVLQAADRLLLISQPTLSSTSSTFTSSSTLSASTISSKGTNIDSNSKVHRGVVDTRLLTAGDEDVAQRIQTELNLQHVRVPLQYLAAAYPLLHVAPSVEGRDVAVAGTRGLAVYHRRSDRWRFFGDAAQERKVKVDALKWLPKGVIVVSATIAASDKNSIIAKRSNPGKLSGAAGPATSSVAPRDAATMAAAAHHDARSLAGASGLNVLLLYPKHHLDASSLLDSYVLPQSPVSLDTTGNYIAVAFAPLEILVLRAVTEDDGRASSNGAASSSADVGSTATSARHRHGTPSIVSLHVIREISILGIDTSLVDITLLPPSTHRRGELNIVVESSDSDRDHDPTHCVVLRGGGVFSVLDMKDGNETVLGYGIELYWLPVSGGAALHIVQQQQQQMVEYSFGGSGGGIDAALQQGPQSTPAKHGTAVAVTPSPVESTLGAGAAADKSSTATSLSPSPARLLGREDSAASIPSTPAAKSGQWLERRVSNAASMAEAAAEIEEIAQIGLEMPWWTYGSRGMQLWFPSSLQQESYSSMTPVDSGTTVPVGAHGLSHSSSSLLLPSVDHVIQDQRASTDPELEFDREVYPLGVSLAEVSIIGVMQRSVRNPSFSPDTPPALAFHPHPESQPVLPCLLRRLLEQGRPADALELATRHCNGPHFARSLEWLLFTALEADADARSARKVAPSSPTMSTPPHGHHRSARGHGVFVQPPSPSTLYKQHGAGGGALGGGLLRSDSSSSGALFSTKGRAGPLLMAAARLVQQFPQAAEIVISVARKTDAQLWPALFAAAGSPAVLCEGLLENGALQSAACSLLIVDHVEGRIKAHTLAVRLLTASLSSGGYDLTTDLLRFLVPVGESDIMAGFKDGNKDPTGAGATGMHPSATGSPTDASNGDGKSGGGMLGYASWMWSYLTGDDKAGVAATNADDGRSAIDNNSTVSNKDNAIQKSRSTMALHAAVSTASLQDLDGAGLTPGIHAWVAIGRHAWKLLDSGALRELSRLGIAMGTLHGGLSALLSTTAREMALSQTHTEPSAAAIASALFVASNEFASSSTISRVSSRKVVGSSVKGNRAESAAERSKAIAELQKACRSAGCVNHAAALALLSGDIEQTDVFAAEHPRVWAVLTDLIANDVHLCGFMSLMSPPGTPLVLTVG